MESWCFRVRFSIAPSSAISISAASAMFELANVGPITMRSYSVGEPIAEANDLLLTGSGYPSRDVAAHAAQRTMGYFQTAFARLRIGADFGVRAPAGAGLGTEFRAQLEEETGRPLLDDVHGAMIFPCEPPPRFFRAFGASITLTQSEAALRAELGWAVAGDSIPSEAEDIAYELFSASFAVAPNADARFLMLMMAIETLIEVQERPATVVEHVDGLIKATEETTFVTEEADGERRSLLGSLRLLRRESISRAGKRLAQRLGDREYMGERPEVFFAKCYEIRSRLVHGHVPRPARQDVDARAASLEVFVSDLLGLGQR